MDEKAAGSVLAFDALFSTDKIRMLKVLTAWLPPSQQGMFALYIKYLELHYTLRLFRNRRPPVQLARKGRLAADFLSGNFFSGDNADAIEFLDELLPYSSPDERSRIDNMKQMLGNMGKLKEVMEMAQMMQEMFPEGFGGDPMDILSGLGAFEG